MEILLKDSNEAHFMQDFIINTAAVRFLDVIGEAASRLSPELKQKYDHVPWNEMKNLRNIISHE